MMIKLILFDLGGVLCEDRNDQILQRWFKNWGYGRHELHQKIFGPTWHRLDKGLITKKEAVRLLRKRFAPARKMGTEFDEIGNYYLGRKQLIELAFSLKKRYAIGILSNMSHSLYQALKRKKFPFSSFNYCFLSYQIGMRKPEHQIYRFVEKNTSFNPEEILFIDDKERNLLPARKRGWKTIHYRSLGQIKKEIKKNL